MSGPPKALRTAYGNALHRTYPALNNGDGQSFERDGSIGPIYSQPCPPCTALAKHRVPCVSPSIEFPVTDPGEIKADGALKQAHEIDKPRTKWSNARCSATKRHASDHTHMHELYASDEAGWKRPPPDYTAADEAGELHAAAKRAFCTSDAPAEALTKYAQDIAQRAADAELARPNAADSVAERHDAEVAARLAASARDAEDEVVVLSQMAVQDAEEDRAGKEATIICGIIARAEAIWDDHLKGILKGNAYGAKPPTPTPAWWGHWHAHPFYLHVCVETIAETIAVDECYDLRERVGQTVKASVPNLVEEAAKYARQAAEYFRWPDERPTHFFGSTVDDIARRLASNPSKRYGSIGQRASTIARHAYPNLGILRPDGRRPWSTIVPTASRVAGAARAIEILDEAQVNKLAAILGFDGEVGPVEAAPAPEPPAVGRLAMAADIAQLYNEMLVSVIEEVAAACCES